MYQKKSCPYKYFLKEKKSYFHPFFSLFLTPEWLTMRTQGAMPSLSLPDFPVASLTALLSVLTMGRATVFGEVAEQFGDLLRLLSINLVKMDASYD